MPIITIQRRMAEQGRIRLGQKVTAKRRDGSDTTRPAKLDRFRFTSPSERLIKAVAEKYGGDAKPWDNDGNAEWEVITDARAIPVIVVKGGFSQWHEYWTKAGCKHRCDGEKDPAGIFCNPEDPAHIEAIARPTTRLSVMLEEIDGLGVWRMETHGWNAAAELPSMAELAMHVGDLVPATLYLAERSAVIDGPKGPQTSRFVVPGLDLAVTKARLIELVGAAGGMAALESASDALQIEAATRPDYEGLLESATTKDELTALWRQAGEAGHLDDDLKAAITAKANSLGGAGEVIEGEVADDAPQPVSWQDVVAIAGEHGMTTTALAEFAEQRYALPVADLEPGQLADLHAAITSGEAAA